MVADQIYVFDLFAGAGGFSAGAAQAGACVVACFENWDKGLAIHYANHPDCVHINMTLGGDVGTFVAEFRALVAKMVPPGAVWHFHASPPCQSFSIAQRQKRPKMALADAEADERSNLLKWAMEVIRELQPPRWSIEQVPTAMKYLQKHVPWLFEADSGVDIYPGVFGYEFGAPTMRKRMFLGKGWSFDGRTTPWDYGAKAPSKKRVRCEAERTLGLRQTCPALCERIVAELNGGDDERVYTMSDLAVKTSANKWCTSKSERAWPIGEGVSGPALGANKWVPCSEGQGLRLLDGTPCFACIASYALWLYKKVDDAPIRNHKTYLDGTWAKVRPMKPSELAAINGMPADYRLDALKTVDLSFAPSITAVVAGEPMRTTTVALTVANKVRGVGNGVVSSIAAQICRSSA